MKPGNAGGGKAATPPERTGEAPAVLRDGPGEASPGTHQTKSSDASDGQLQQLVQPPGRGTSAVGVRGTGGREGPGGGRDRRGGIRAGTGSETEVAAGPPASRRVPPTTESKAGIRKGDGRLRQLGIPATEDKLVQGALAAVLTEVYEEEFHDFSYGFRPGRSCHDALRELARHIGHDKVSWVVEADIKGFYDNIDHEWLLAMVGHRVSDERVLRLIRGMLTAGVMEEGSRVETEAGTPQGGVISPLLANIYLHYALDEWFAKVVKKGCQGEAYLVRYEDDFVACFEYETDACRFRTALAVRLGRFKLEVEPTKTQMLRFGRFAKRDAQMRGERVAVFDFLRLTAKALWRGLNRRSQRLSFSWEEFWRYVDRYPLAGPRRVVNLNPGFA